MLHKLYTLQFKQALNCLSNMYHFVIIILNNFLYFDQIIMLNYKKHKF